MRYLEKIKMAVVVEILCLVGLLLYVNFNENQRYVATTATKKDYIKWVDFKVPYEALDSAYHWDVDTYQKKIHIDWIELLAYAAAKGGGEWERGSVREMEKTAEALASQETTVKELTKKLKYYEYYKEAYQAVLGGYVGEYTCMDENGKTKEKKYGLKAFSPIAKGFPYSDYGDFGVSRSYGYKREHLGHDMMGQVGTPIIATESGYVEALGWNQYGGWRIGIRSFDKKRYYYYAHLRQNYPYQKALEEGSIVTAGEVIGYMGHTGYSAKENVNNIKTVHLHYGIQLIFDESQKEGNTEIWIDPYQLCRFLYRNQAAVEKVPDTKEWKSVTVIEDPMVIDYQKQHKGKTIRKEIKEDEKQSAKKEEMRYEEQRDGMAEK